MYLWLMEMINVDDFEWLILPGAGEYGFSALSCFGVNLPLQALRAHAFKHALHVAVDRANYFWVFDQLVLECGFARVLEFTQQVWSADNEYPVDVVQ